MYIDRTRRVSVCRNYVNSTLQDASNKEVAGIAIVVLVLMVSPIIIILMRNAVATIQVCIGERLDVILFDPLSVKAAAQPHCLRPMKFS